MINKSLFLKIEGDKYFLRNKKKLNSTNYEKDKLQILISRKLSEFKSKKIKLLEIGCGDGGRLSYLNKKFPNVDFFGLEPSKIALKNINKKIKIKKGSADNLPFPNNFFDIIVFGFCLYLVDDKDLFNVANETDRIMRSKSWLFIKDFETKNLTYKKYKHNKKIKIRKMDYTKMFLWSPYMTLSSKEIFSHDKKETWSDNEDNKIAINCIRKNS